jgi:methyl-accepting chemotaxis protein
MDETTRKACESDKPATLATYRMELGDKYFPVKNVFVPIYFKGRRWGNFELAYRDDKKGERANLLARLWLLSTHCGH